MAQADAGCFRPILRAHGNRLAIRSPLGTPGIDLITCCKVSVFADPFNVRHILAIGIDVDAVIPDPGFQLLDVGCLQLLDEGRLQHHTYVEAKTFAVPSG